MVNPIYEQNLACLSPQLRELLAAYPSPSPTVIVVQGEERWPVARLQTEAGVIHSNSLVDPCQEASLWAESLDYQDVMVSFIYGCGFGYPLLEYARRKHRYTETIIFEHDPNFFQAMLATVDLTMLLTNPSFHFVVGDTAQMQRAFREIVTSEFLLRSTKPASFFTWLAHRNFKHIYLDIHEWVWNSLELSLTGVGNSVQDTLVGMYNMLDNVAPSMGCPPLSAFKDVYRDVPAFIVANGPSLDKNIERLAQAKGKALILSAESALKPCMKRGIVPDAVSILERTPNSYHSHFKNANLPPELVMVGLNLIDPRIPREFPGTWIPVYRKYESTSIWINEALGDGCGLHGGASSAHLAFEFALLVGANPIIFVGQDLAFGPGQSTHSQHSSYGEQHMAEHVQALQAQPVFMVKSVDGSMIPTIKIWYEFKTWFEDRIARSPDVRFIDCTEGGAYIEGTELMELERAVAEFCRKPLAVTLNEQAKRTASPDIHGQAEKYQLLLDKIKDIRARFKRLSTQANQDISNCKVVEKACALQQKLNRPLPAFVSSQFERNLNEFRKYGSDQEVVAFTQAVIFAHFKELNALGEINSTEKILLGTRIIRSMFEYLKATCVQMTQHFELAEARIREQMKKG